MQIRKPDGMAHAIELCRRVELAHCFAFDPTLVRGEKAHLSFSQGVHVSFCARQSGIGFEWPPKLVSRQRLLLFREALIYLSYSGLKGDGLMDLWMLGFLRCNAERIARSPSIHLSNNPVCKMVVPAGNAPASSGYQPGALLLSYRTEIGSSGAPW